MSTWYGTIGIGHICSGLEGERQEVRKSNWFDKSSDSIYENTTQQTNTFIILLFRYYRFTVSKLMVDS